MGNLVFQAASGGQVALSGPNTASSFTIAVPAVTGTLVTTGDTGTVTTTMLASTTGSGAVVLATSPTLVTPVLGTPTSGTLTNCTGLPISTGLSGLTTNGVAYASSTSALTTGSALTFDGTNFALTQSGNPTLTVKTTGAGNNPLYRLQADTNYWEMLGVFSDANDTLRFRYNGTDSYIIDNTGISAWSVGGSEQMRLNSTGLGIGTSSPGAKLQVSSASDDILRLTATAPYLSFYNGATRTGYIRANTSGVFGIVSEDASTPMAFYTAGAEKMRLDTSGNLGLGVTPSAWNSVYKGFQIGLGASVFGRTANSNAAISANAFVNSAGNFQYINTEAASYYLQGGGTHYWTIAPSGTAGNAITFTQAMTLDASGNLFVGATALTSNANYFATSPGNSFSDFGHVTGTASGISYTRFLYAGGVIGSITQSGTTAVLYNLTSDQRLKENIQDAEDAATLIDAIQVRQYDWKSDGSHQRYGFVAQELVTVAPEAVHQPADPEEMMAVDYSKLVPMLVKEIQSLRKRLAALEAK